jgi:hypothetical protein
MIIAFLPVSERIKAKKLQGRWSLLNAKARLSDIISLVKSEGAPLPASITDCQLSPVTPQTLLGQGHRFSIRGSIPLLLMQMNEASQHYINRNS